MEQKKFEAMLVLIVPKVIDMIAEEMKLDEYEHFFPFSRAMYLCIMDCLISIKTIVAM